MPRYEITSPDGRRYEITAPDGATQAQVLAYAQSQHKSEPDAPVSPTDGMSGTEKFLAGVGKGMMDLGRGVGQRVGLVSDQEVEDSRKRDAPLMNSGAGAVGNFVGNVAAAAPAMLVPGANTVAGAGLIGAGLGAAQPTAGNESAIKNATFGAVGGAGAQYGLGKLASYAGSRLASATTKGEQLAAQNAPRDATIRSAQEAGMVLPPSQVNPSALNRMAEGYAGKISTQQGASIKNQPRVDALIKGDLGIPENQAATAKAIEAVRTKAYNEGYAPIKAAKGLLPDEQFAQDVGKLGGSDYAALAKEVPEMASPEIEKVVSALSKPEFSGSTAIAMIRRLRKDASANFKNAIDPAAQDAARAQIGAAEALEGLIDRNLAARGAEGAAAKFREARQMIAKSHDAEAALNEATGSFKAGYFGKQFDKGRPLTGGMRQVGEIANAFPKAVQEVNTSMPGVSPLDYAAVGGISAATGIPSLLAGVIGRPAVRAAVTSQPWQKILAKPPQYGPGLLTRNAPVALDELEKLGFGGLLGPSIYGTQ